MFVCLIIPSIAGAQKPTRLIENVLFQLGLRIEDCYEELITEKQVPGAPKESIVVIPKIAGMDQGMFGLDTYIVVVNNVNGNIKHKYYESNATNGWDSDGIHLTGITIDTAPYILKGNTRGFGIRVSFRANSKPNPYSSETLTLFMPKGSKLIPVLKNYEVDRYTGEWDMQCNGEFHEMQKVLVIRESKTNDYFDILVKTKQSTIINTRDAKGKCQETIREEKKEQLLKFQGNTYR